jgi:fructoselysine-6-P-deglycase FrlB-like protein
MLQNDNPVYKEVLQKGISQRPRIEEIVSKILEEKRIDTLFLVGCGGSLAVMLPCKYIMDRYSTLPTQVYNASEFVTLQPKAFSKHSLVIVSSYSGKTPETVEVARLAKEKGATTLGFMGKEDSPLGLAVDYAFANDAPIGVTDSKIIMLYQILFNILYARKEYAEYDRLMAAIDTLPENLVAIKDAAEPFAQSFAEKYKDEEFFMVLGAGIGWGEAYSYAICILEEMQWIKAQPIHSGEFFHGSFEIVREDSNLLIFKGEDPSRSLGDRAEKFARKYARNVTVVDPKDYALLGVDEEMRPFFSPLIVSAVMDRVSRNLEAIRNHSLKLRKYMGIVEY